MDKAGKSVLWFLGACLLFSQSLMAVVAKIETSIGGGWILFFGFLCLVSVLVSLLTMFLRNPAFLTAERGDLIPLSLIQHIAKDNNPDLLKQLILNLSPKALYPSKIDEVENDELESDVNESEIDEEGNEEHDDSKEYDAALSKILNK